MQRILAEAFGAARRDMACTPPVVRCPDDEKADPLIAGLKICADTARHVGEWEKRKLRGWREAAIKYHEDRAGRVSLIAPDDPAIARARRLMAAEVSIERVWAEVSRPTGVAGGQ